jgi:hypothetical protein
MVKRWVVQWKDSRKPGLDGGYATTLEDRGQAEVLLAYIEERPELQLVDFKELG